MLPHSDQSVIYYLTFTFLNWTMIKDILSFNLNMLLKSSTPSTMCTTHCTGRAIFLILCSHDTTHCVVSWLQLYSAWHWCQWFPTSNQGGLDEKGILAIVFPYIHLYADSRFQIRFSFQIPDSIFKVKFLITEFSRPNSQFHTILCPTFLDPETINLV